MVQKLISSQASAATAHKEESALNMFGFTSIMVVVMVPKRVGPSLYLSAANR